MIAPMADPQKPSKNQGKDTGFPPHSHALPTSHEVSGNQDPDLVRIVASWDRLADEIKDRLVEIVQANLPTKRNAE